jgi:hypothetical protein
MYWFKKVVSRIITLIERKSDFRETLSRHNALQLRERAKKRFLDSVSSTDNAKIWQQSGKFLYLTMGMKTVE